MPDLETNGDRHADLQKDGLLPSQDKKYSIYGPSGVGSFKFCVIHKSVPRRTELATLDEFILRTKYAIRRVAGSRIKWYGLDTASLIIERVPLIVAPGGSQRRIQRIDSPEVPDASGAAPDVAPDDAPDA